MRLELGNTKAKSARRNDGDDSVTFEPLKGKRVTVVEFPEDVSLSEAFASVTAANGIWANHSDKPPAWVASDSPGLQALLAEHFGCEEGAPKDLEDNYHTLNGPPGVGPKQGEKR